LQQRPGASLQPLALLVREYAALAATPEARLERFQSGRTLARAYSGSIRPSAQRYWIK
jgi:hypothetical protein